MRRKLATIFLGLFCIAIFGIVACAEEVNDSQKSEQNRQQSVDQRANNFARAVAKYPQPDQVNFPMREALVKYTQRQDLLNHPWYIYVANECFQCSGGIAYIYFIGQTYPQSTCNFLGSTEEIKRFEKGSDGVTAVKLIAPSLDGIFYGGGGSAGGGCDYFFFDMATDAMQVVHHGWNWFVSDRILLLDAKLMRTQ